MTDERYDAILRLRAKSGTRLVVRGNSMLPLLRDGMILEVGAYEGNARIGDVVIFRQRQKLVAHRVVALTPEGVAASGDAVPQNVQDVKRDAILAIATGVRESDAAAAPRIDGRLFALRGRLYAYCQPARGRLARAKEIVIKAARSGAPWRRPRIQPALVQMLSAILRRDEAALLSAIGTPPADRLVESIVRHRCVEPVLEAIRPLSDDTATANLRSLLVPIVRRNAVQTMLQRRDIVAVVEIMTTSGVPFALLKGAAQVFCSEATFVHHSLDIDLFVSREAASAAVQALGRAGYRFQSDDATQRRYLKTHHHLAPLYPPKRGPQIELHTALAPPRKLGLRTDWEALKAHLIEVATQHGSARCFDAFGMALHYAIHSMEVPRLRDIFYCARLLSELDQGQRAELHRLARSEAIDPIRLSASLTLAARVAGLPWPSDSKVERCLDWLSWRDDAPAALQSKNRLAHLYAAAMRVRDLRVLS